MGVYDYSRIGMVAIESDITDLDDAVNYFRELSKDYPERTYYFSFQDGGWDIIRRREPLNDPR